jgi:hypothetical protein
MHGKEYPNSPSKDVVFVFVVTRLSQFCQDTECDSCRSLQACLKWHSRLSGSSTRGSLSWRAGEKYLRILERDIIRTRQRRVAE